MKLPKTVKISGGEYEVTAPCCGEGAKLLTIFSSRQKADEVRLDHLDMFHADDNPSEIETFDCMEDAQAYDRDKESE